ncbi:MULTISPECIES: DNA repair protein RecO [unclassified Schlesneria]|uniref:DNA repair protein RecO n=1 Tax=Schlesneria TaxID=656899 RepID=UPI002F11460C
MSSEKSEGLLLRVTDYSESSRIVVIFTRDFGKISALAKGGRRLKGPFESALDLLSTCQIVFLRKNTSGLDLLTEAKLVTRFHPQERDLACLYAGYYLAEILLALTEDYDPHPVLYSAAQDALNLFQNSETMLLGVIRFELVLLREIGQLPDLENCVACGAELTAGRTFGYWVSEGGLICPDCQREGYTQIAVHAGAAAAMRLLSSESETDWKRLNLTPAQLKELKRITTSAICHVMGKRPKMLKYLDH